MSDTMLLFSVCGVFALLVSYILYSTDKYVDELIDGIKQTLNK